MCKYTENCNTKHQIMERLTEKQRQQHALLNPMDKTHMDMHKENDSTTVFECVVSKKS